MPDTPPPAGRRGKAGRGGAGTRPRLLLPYVTAPHYFYYLFHLCAPLAPWDIHPFPLPSLPLTPTSSREPILTTPALEPP